MKMEREIERLPLRERNRQRIRQRILDAAFALFGTVGYNQTTMDAIAEQAEVSRGTLFNYFSTKSALLVPFMKELYWQQVRPEIMPYLETQPTTVQALRFLFMNIYERIFKFPDMHHALQALKQEVSHTYDEAIDINEGTGFLDNIQAILQHGRQRGDVRDDIALEQLTRYVGVLYVALVENIIDPPGAAHYTDEVEILLAFIQSGCHK